MRDVDKVIVVVACAASAFLGYFYTEHRCSVAILSGKVDQCPAKIATALTAMKVDPAPIIKIVQQNDRKSEAKLKEDVHEIQTVAETRACAATPAFTALRRQLCEQAGPGACEDPGVGVQLPEAGPTVVGDGNGQ